MAAVCPVVGTTTSVLPPHHPSLNYDDKEAVCPVTNAKIADHGASIIHEHPGSSEIPSSDAQAMDATSCPALKNANEKDSITEATCPVVGPVSAVLPPDHPSVEKAEAGSKCPVTLATLDHHKGKLINHPSVPKGEGKAQCPVAGQAIES